MKKPAQTGLQRILDATVYSFAGLAAAWRHEAAFRQECVLVAMLLPLAFWLGQTTAERAVLISSLFVVIITELLNSAIEVLTDRVGSERHELSGRAKDLASAAVMLSLVLVLCVWGVIGYSRFAG
jgi:diacylglycerol kinase (ATP)